MQDNNESRTHRGFGLLQVLRPRHVHHGAPRAEELQRRGALHGGDDGEGHLRAAVGGWKGGKGRNTSQ